MHKTYCLVILSQLRNTFPPGEDSFVPKVSVGSDSIDFPSCYIDRAVYRTIRLANLGDQPVIYSFMSTPDDPLSPPSDEQVFSVKPKVGILQKNDSQLVVFRFSPSEAKFYEKSLKVFFNGSLTNDYVTKPDNVKSTYFYFIR